MRRTLQINLQTTISIFCVLSWLSCAGVQGLPAASRTASGEPRRRGGDDLIAGSDFLNMFIGAKVDPTVRSRRFPLISGDVVDPRQGHSEDRGASRQLRPSEGQDVDARTHRRANIIDPHERLSGLIRSQDRQNYGSETQYSHNSNKVDHSEDLQRRGSAKFKYVHTIGSLEDHVDAVTEESKVSDASASKERVFGDRMLPRTSSNTPSSVTPSEPATVAIDPTESYNTASSTASDVPNSSETTVSNEDQTYTSEANVDVTEKVPVSPKFSVSSSIKKFISKEDKSLTSDNKSNDEDKSTSLNNNDDNEVGKEHVSQTTTESSSYTTEVESTLSTETEPPAELNESWSTSSEDVTAEPTVTASVEEIPDGAQFQKIGVPEDRQETAVKVVSVRVSSSVAQVASLPREVTEKKNTVLNTIVEEPSIDVESEYKEQSSEHSRSESFSLETEDHPPVTAIQRSELVVEESSPSEVTAVPFSSYTSFLSSKFQPASTHFYQPPLQHTSPNPREGVLSYQSSLTPASARRLQFFNHPPRNYRNHHIEALRRSSEGSVLLNGYAKAGIQDAGSRRYATHRVADTGYQSLRQEPVSVAESIQRSVIARQDADRSEATSRGQFHQDKNAFVDGRYQGEESGERKRYSSPERVWGEPEKVYGEPEKVYGEPEKVYGEPEKVYGEPEKVYAEPEKVYGEPEKVYGEPEKVYGEPEKNYEVDEAVSVLSNGRAHGVQGTTPGDSAIKMIDAKPQDPNHKFGYVVEGRNFRKYRVEERTSDGFIVGEYGVVSHDDGSLRGVRYTADESINPRLIYDTLVKFLSL